MCAILAFVSPAYVGSKGLTRFFADLVSSWKCGNSFCIRDLRTRYTLLMIITATAFLSRPAAEEVLISHSSSNLPRIQMILEYVVA